MHNSFLGCGVTGETVALEGKQPKICYDGRLVPICGHFFWRNNFGARLFCQMLGRDGGVILPRPGISLAEDAYYVGECSSTDTHFNSCSAGMNMRTLGGLSSLYKDSCSKHSKALVHLSCIGKTFFITSHCL